MSPRNDKEGTPMIPQQWGCSNKTWRTTTPAYMLTQKGETSWSPTHRQRTTAYQRPALTYRGKLRLVWIGHWWHPTAASTDSRGGLKGKEEEGNASPDCAWCECHWEWLAGNDGSWWHRHMLSLGHWWWPNSRGKNLSLGGWSKAGRLQ